jgi:prepilin-type N-terminal cleavage/methylation domain-containing protein
MKTPTRGFTLIEILIVIGMLALLAGVVLVAVNPLRQFAEARNTQRQSNVAEILSAVGQRTAENRGVFANASSTCSASLPSTVAAIKKSGGYDLRTCIVPDFISEIPVDPTTGKNTCASTDCSGGDYDTGYTIQQEASTTRVTVCAPSAAESAIKGSAAFCLTR